ncbi:hypothetical protein Ppa06_29810 [Planomonospora parontospora subsp. parontospora]|uniref:Lipoprotein n=2 Tax=Planomonospora parontospora TaxID=58119 RepID=A0AA37BHX2_9ACTN|nr:hypothetical protein GCM10010126_33900 [Planomonospora parontospora]GII09183.1 hypothetical protein Ppa06_29810 [Planomonospora parontospora subsp. parontospora]
MGRGIRAAAVIAVWGVLAGLPAGCGTGPAAGGGTRAGAHAGSGAVSDAGAETGAGTGARTDVRADAVAGGDAGAGTETVLHSGAAGTGADRTRLRGLLLQTQDLPEGFSARLRGGWRPPFRPAAGDCRRVLESAGHRAPQGASDVRVTATYPGHGLGELAGIGLESHPGEGAERRFAALAAALDRCRVAAVPATGAAADRETLLTGSDLALDAVGDDMRARRLHGRLNGYPYEMHVVLIRSGRTLVSLVHAGIADVDAGRTQRLAGFLADRAGGSAGDGDET